jgi:hypothetical protein
VVAGVARMTGKAADRVRSELAEALARPQALENADLRAGVERLHALTEARTEVAAAIAEGRLRAAAPIAALDPHASPVGWRVALRRATQAATEHAPPPSPDTDRAVLDGHRATVGDVLALLRARRAALGVAADVPARSGSAAALLDGAVGTLGEAVTEGRLSARAPMAAVPPADRKAWRASFRDAAAATARQAGATTARAEAHGWQAASLAYERGREVSRVAEALRARDAAAPGAERAIQAAIEAVRRSEQAAVEQAAVAAAARAEQARRQVERVAPEPSYSPGSSYSPGM